VTRPELASGSGLTVNADETLLAGSGGTVYEVGLRGNEAAAYDRLAAQPWVTHVQPAAPGANSALLVSVSDAQAAEAQLLRLLLADESLVITHFGRKAHELEEVFMDVVEGGQHGR
jgi:ABC-2 type transport system ATP-binding protein